MQELLRMEGVSKHFPGVIALNNVSFHVNKGEVLAVVGENGAGKSTLMKILSGVHKMDAGEFFLDGEGAQIYSPTDAIKKGISIIYQELSQMPNLSVYENIFAGRELKKGFLYDHKGMQARAQEIIDRMKVNVDSRTLVSDLSIAQRQMVEIAKAIAFNSRLIIMDEPTSSLTDIETGILMEIIEGLRDDGVSVMYISHKLNEVLKLGDRVMVIRDGEHIETLDREDCTEQRLIRSIIGRDLGDLYPKRQVDLGDVILSCKNLCAQKGYIKNIDFELRKGEVLGFYGLIGAGRSEVAEAIFGVSRKEGGSVVIDNKEYKPNSPKHAIKAGIGLVTEDRKLSGLVLDMDVRENTTMASLNAVSTNYIINDKKEWNLAQEYVEKMKTKTPSLWQKVCNLSGGNQQKVVLSKWLATNPKVLILDEPTRGIDIGAKREIYMLIEQLVSQGLGIIMISSELPEVLSMSDRILVMHNGAVCGELSREEASEESIMSLILANG